MESLILWNEKKDKTIKDRMCANGCTQRSCILCKEATSTTAALEAIIISGVIDTKHKRDAMRLDIPNPLLHTEIALDRENIIMKIRGQLVNILLEICTVVYII